MTDSGETAAYGLHLMLDGYRADPGLLGDLGHVFRVLDEFPALIGMTKIGFPQLARFERSDIAGVSGIVMIVESHISVHTYVNQGFVTADVYSCRSFDAEAAVAYLESGFGIGESEVHLVRRGSCFPGGKVR